MNIVNVDYSLSLKDYKQLIKERIPFEMERLKAGKFITLVFNSPIARFFIFLYGSFRKRKVFSEDTVIKVTISEKEIVTRVLENEVINKWDDAFYVVDLNDFFTFEFESNTVVLPKRKLSGIDKELIMDFANLNNKVIKTNL